MEQATNDPVALDDGLSLLAATDPREEHLLAMIFEGEKMGICEFTQEIAVSKKKGRYRKCSLDKKSDRAHSLVDFGD